ncbi:glycosyltransferase [Variovorax sp. J2P1-59]|uniref:glycosyltransferase n=1 Tax=Variovorax flavidus TaxID=3053501 RepID=UPI002575C6D7|nr:glycosyltransferase [Variovorax sp. J2P1-59]MDM0078629.1 glycosyltransferase [Variovorax sp. J2P1-59]
MLGIVVPAHNEAALIADCVLAIMKCAHSPRLEGEPVELVVVADACTDATATLAAHAGALTLEIAVRNVGVARATGAELLLSRGARWLAFTDADTIVSRDWLAEQLDLDADAVCGTVEVQDWTPHGEHANLLCWHFGQTYTDKDEHRHVHGANLGVSATAYRLAGGFQSIACGEDVALIAALEAAGARIAWSARPRVITSARRKGRAVGGFADALVEAVAFRLRADALSPLLFST